MNYLNGMTVYLAGSIKSASDDGTGWRKKITPRLENLGIKVLDPCNKKNTLSEISEIGEQKKYFRDLILKKDFEKLKEKFWPVVRSDLRAVDVCNFVILNYEDPEMASIGTVHEAVLSQIEKKVVLLKFIDTPEKLQHFNPWMATFVKSHHFFSEWDQMFEYLGKVNDGILDTSLWVI